MQTSLESQNGVMWPQSFHDFYDPNGYFGGNGGLLLEYLYAQRQQRLALGHVPQIGGQEIDNPRMQIAIEIGHLALKSNDNVSEWSGLGLNETTLKTAVDIAEADVAQNIAWVHRVVDGLLLVEKVQTRIQEMGDEGDETGIKILLAGMVVAAVAHNGQFRLNDIEYFNHPLAVAKILSTAVHGLPNWNKRVQNKSALWLRMLQYEALNHDAFENELPDHKDESLRGTSFLEEKNLLASPLFHQRLLESYLKEEDKPMAAEAAHDIYLLSKPVGPDGHITNDRYMHRLKGHSKALLVKLGDITHNLKIDPKLKPIRNRKKRAKWKDNRQEYRRNIRFIYKTLWFSRASLSEKRLAGRITTVDKYRLEVFESSRLLSQFTSSELVAEYSQCEDKDTSQGNGDSLD